MQQVTVGPKYQIVIPKEIRKQLRILEPGSKVTVKRVDDRTLIIQTAGANSWADKTRGIASEAWKGIDTTKYLEDLKNEWEKQS